jgi:hypothetical protein
MDLFAADGVLHGIGGVDGVDTLQGAQLSGLIVYPRPGAARRGPAGVLPGCDRAVW